MRQPLMYGLILASLLSGCTTPVTIRTEPVDLEGTITSGIAAKKLPVGTPTTGTKAPGTGKLGGSGAPIASGTKAPVTNGQAVGTTATNTTGSTASEAAQASNGPPHLEIQESPRKSLAILPIIAGDGSVVDLDFNAKDPILTWKVAYLGGKAVSISKIKVTYTGDSDPWSVDLTPQDLEWPATLGAGTQELPFALDIGATFEYFGTQQNPSNRLAITIQLFDASDKPLAGSDGQEVKLTAPVSVL